MEESWLFLNTLFFDLYSLFNPFSLQILAEQPPYACFWQVPGLEGKKPQSFPGGLGILQQDAAKWWVLVKWAGGGALEPTAQTHPARRGGGFLDTEMPKVSVKGPVGRAENRRKAIPHEGNMK